MILTCGKCQTNYMVKAEAVGVGGRLVKCIKCGHTWKQYPEGTTPTDQVEPIPEIIRSIPRGSALPVIQDNSVSLSLRMLAMGLFALALVVSFALYHEQVVQRYPSMAAVYNAVGLYDVREVALQRLEIIPKESAEGEKQEYVLRGRLVNRATEKKILPNLKITVRDKEKGSIQSLTLKSSGEILAPGETLDFSNTITKLPEGSEFLTVDLGNKVELWMR